MTLREMHAGIEDLIEKGDSWDTRIDVMLKLPNGSACLGVPVGVAHIIENTVVVLCAEFVAFKPANEEVF
jgi:hypothetical protein